MDQFSPQQAMNALVEIHQQAKNLQDPALLNILVNLTHWFVSMLNYLNGNMSSLLPKLSALEQKFNNEIDLINKKVVDLQKQKPSFQPKIKSNIVAILEESFGVQDCLNIIKKKAQDNNDSLCIEIVNNGYFYPKMLQYVAEHFNQHIIIYNAKKKKYFKYGQKNQQPLFIYQKNSQTFNLMRKKNKLSAPTPAQTPPLTIFNTQPTLFSKQSLQQESIIKSIEQQVLHNLQSSIKKQVSSIQNVQPQIQSSAKQVQFQTLYKMPSQQQYNQFSEEQEEVEEQLFFCGGKFNQCKNTFSHFEEYLQHMKKYHKNKVPKEGSHTLDGQIIE